METIVTSSTSSNTCKLLDLPDELLMNVLIFLIGDEFTTPHHSLQPIHKELYKYSELTATHQVWSDWTRRNTIDYFELANLIIPICGVNKALRSRLRQSENFKKFWRRYFNRSLDMMNFLMSAPKRIHIPTRNYWHNGVGIAALDLIVDQSFSNLQSFFKHKKRLKYFYSIEIDLLEMFCQLVNDIYGSDIIEEVECLSICYSCFEKVHDMLKMVGNKFPNLTSLIVTDIQASEEKNMAIPQFTFSSSGGDNGGDDSEEIKLNHLKVFSCPTLSSRVLSDSKLKNQLEELIVSDSELSETRSLTNLVSVGVHDFNQFSTFSNNWKRKFDPLMESLHDKLSVLATVSATEKAFNYALSKNYFSNIRELYITYSRFAMVLDSTIELPHLEILSTDGGVTVTLDGVQLPKLWKLGCYHRGSITTVTERQRKLPNLKDISCEIESSEFWNNPSLEKISFTSTSSLSPITFSGLPNLRALHSVSCPELIIDNCPQLEYIKTERNVGSVKIVNQKRIHHFSHGLYANAPLNLHLDIERCETLELYGGTILEFNVKHISQLIMSNSAESLLGKVGQTEVDELRIESWTVENPEPLLQLIQEFKHVGKITISISGYQEPISTCTSFVNIVGNDSSSTICNQISDFFNGTAIIKRRGEVGDDDDNDNFLICKQLPQQTHQVKIRSEKFVILSNIPHLEDLSSTSNYLPQLLSVDLYSAKNLKKLTLESTYLFKHSLLSSIMDSNNKNEKESISSHESVQEENIESIDLSLFPLIESVDILHCKHVKLKASGVKLQHLKKLQLFGNDKLEINLTQLELPHIRSLIIFNNLEIVQPGSVVQIISGGNNNKVIFKLIQPNLIQKE